MEQTVGNSVGDDEMDPLEEGNGLAEPHADGVCDAVAQLVPVLDGELDPKSEGEALAEAHAEGEKDPVPQADTDPNGEWEAHAEALVEGQGVADRAALRLPLLLAE